MVFIPGQPPQEFYLSLYEIDYGFATWSQVQTSDENENFTGSIKILNYIANIRNTAMLAPRRTGRKLCTGYKIRKNVP